MMKPIPMHDMTMLNEIANRLPAKQGTELMQLVETWSKSMRQSPRRQYNEHVRFIAGGKQYGGSAKDLSTAGIFIDVQASLHVGEQVQVVLNMNHCPLPVEVSATVVRQALSGVGIRFNYENVGDKSLIDDFIKSLD